MMRYLFNAIKIIALICLLFLSAFVINNRGDEELNSEAAQALVWKTPENTFEDNGHLILLGIEAPIEQDAAVVGKKIQEAELARFALMQTTHKEPPPAEQTQLVKHSDWKDKRCDFTLQKNCVDYYLQMGNDQLAAVISSQDRLVKRFQAIKQSKNYVEAMPPMITSHLPSYQYLVQGSELEHMQAILDISAGRSAQGMARLTENSLFSRRLLRESNTLISHMIALSLMQRDTRNVSELLVKYPVLAKQHRNQFEMMLAPISLPEYSLVKSLTSDRNLILHILNNLKYATRNELTGTENNIFLQSFAWLGFQANATVNLAYQSLTSQIELAMVDAAYLDTVKARHTQLRADIVEMDHTLFTKRNPVGRILNANATPTYSNYIERQHDLAGHMRIVGIQLMMLADDIPVNNAVLTFHNPYTRAVMPFDRHTGILTFEGRQASNSNFNKSSQYQVKLQ
jgi:hypothetical protein